MGRQTNMLKSYYNLKFVLSLVSKCITHNLALFFRTNLQKKLHNSNVLNMKNFKNKTPFFDEILKSTMWTEPDYQPSTS